MGNYRRPDQSSSEYPDDEHSGSDGSQFDGDSSNNDLAPRSDVLDIRPSSLDWQMIANWTDETEDESEASAE